MGPSDCRENCIYRLVANENEGQIDLSNTIRVELHPVNHIAERTATRLAANENEGHIYLANMIRVEWRSNQIAERTASIGW